MLTSTSVRTLKYRLLLTTACNLSLGLSRRKEGETQKICLIGMRPMLVRTFRNGKLFHLDKRTMWFNLSLNSMAATSSTLSMQRAGATLQLMTRAKRGMGCRRPMSGCIMGQIRTSSSQPTSYLNLKHLLILWTSLARYYLGRRTRRAVNKYARCT
jgi:hypothetical protein